MTQRTLCAGREVDVQALTAIAVDREISGFAQIGNLIDAIATDGFEAVLFDSLDYLSSAEHCGVYWYSNRELQRRWGFSRNGSGASHRMSRRYVAEDYWIKDPAIKLVANRGKIGGAFLIASDSSIGPTDLKEEIFLSQNMHYRLLVCQSRAEGIAILDLVRSASLGPFLESELRRSRDTALGVLPAVFKHVGLLQETRSPNDEGALSSIPAIEERICSGPVYFPRRERQVLAQNLFGVMTHGIGLTLGISEETVTTYRKRAYGRLHIATRHEMLKWYLEQCVEKH
jgi:DNA-binding CsgD family transcriptional regulator